MGKKKPGPFSGQQTTPKPFVDKNFVTFFVVKRISPLNETFHSVSPFLVDKAITRSIGEVPSVRKLRSGDLLIEVASRNQSQKISKIKTFGTIPVSISPHATLNSSKGVISCGELLNVTLEEISEKLQCQGVSHVQRISIRRDGQLLATKHLVLTFNSPKLPQSIKAGYINLSVRPYIPNPLRCFKCQRFGHSQTGCRGALTCARCATFGHLSSDCTEPEKCVNCKGSHTSYSRSCPIWKTEKEIVAVKVKEQVSYPEARRIVKARTSTPGISYSSVVRGTLISTGIQYDLQDLNPGSSANVSDQIVASETSKFVVTASNTSQHKCKKLKSASLRSLALKNSKQGIPQGDVREIPSLTVQNSVALGLAKEGIVHKDFPSIFSVPKSPDSISLHPSEEDDDDFQMSCDASATLGNGTNIVSPNSVS
ncbi:hypothetical protein AVEN_10317-1 [Araneus ventricosus]|uniref:CCHC-type domain-containing protein n=1 Tax=Araneus ventricosus TaxID=182803 RepID=A0A4Y2X3M1_ARAVE|nr:hypothetical protein AVEN_10317-1 [Araneus ventricosus]